MMTTKQIPLHSGEMHTLEKPLQLGDNVFHEITCLSPLGWSANEFIVIGVPRGSDVGMKFIIIYDLDTMTPFAIDLVHDGEGLSVVAA
jgi:hypothetical protein